MASADTVPSGRLVLAEVDGVTLIGLKASRRGKDHVNHYLVPLDPRPAEPLRLRYIDYAVRVLDCTSSFAIRLEPAAGLKSEVGQAIITAAGTFIKVYETKVEGSMAFSYVDVATGEVRRRQEQGVTAVLDVRLIATGPDPRQTALRPRIMRRMRKPG